VFALVKHGLGIAVLDEFTVAETPLAGVSKIPIAEPTEFPDLFRLSQGCDALEFCEYFVAALRTEMQGQAGQQSTRTLPKAKVKAAGKK